LVLLTSSVLCFSFFFFILVPLGQMRVEMNISFSTRFIVMMLITQGLLCNLAFAFQSPVSCGGLRQRSKIAGTKRTRTFMGMVSGTDATKYVDYLKGPAGLGEVVVPSRLGNLLGLLQIVAGEELADPHNRKGLHPLFIPLTKKEGTYTGILRWPTPPEDLPVPIVRTNGLGMKLLSNDPEHLIRRLVVEADAADHPDIEGIVEIGNQQLGQDQHYHQGDVQKLNLGVDKYLLMRVGPFMDVYENLVQGHLGREDEQSALVAAERSNSVFKGWGRPYAFYSNVMKNMYARELESKDAAKVAMRLPLWTAAYDSEELEKLVALAGYTEMKTAEQLYEKMAADEQKDKITEGKAPMQVALDRTAHVMDRAMFQEAGWDGIRDELAELYIEGGIPELADFVKNC